MLSLQFFLSPDVLSIARDLLGMILVTEINGKRTAGKITETEAYRAPEDRASHAFGNRKTKRTAVLFEQGGRSYVYLCYGIHHLFNVVTGPEGTPHAVLIRGVEPLEGIDVMLQRRKMEVFSPRITTGPGALSQALGITTDWNNTSLVDSPTAIWVEDRGMGLSDSRVMTGKRIGVDYAGEWAERPWRFWEGGSEFIKF